MTGFPFTRKKLLSLPPARRHKWVTKWLRGLYLSFAAGGVSPAAREGLFQEIVRLHTWLDVPLARRAAPVNRREWIEFISDTFHDHQQLTGLGLSEPDLLPHVSTGDRSVPTPWTPSVHYHVALDNLRSAFNVGSFFRLADAAGFESVLLSAKTPGPENRQVQKTAMGAADWIPFHKAESLVELLTALKKQGYRCIGLETVSASAAYLSYPWPARGVVVTGNEEYGISDPVLKACDDFVHIPMSGSKNSINVAAAFAVIAFHISSLFSTPLLR